MNDPIHADANSNGRGSPSNFGVLQERVSNIDRRLAELAASIEKTNIVLARATEAMAALGKPKWQALTAGGTLICVLTAAIWGLAVAPIKDDIARLYSGMHDIVLSNDAQNRLFDVELKSKLDRAAVDDIRQDMKVKIQALNQKLDELNAKRR